MLALETCLASAQGRLGSGCPVSCLDKVQGNASAHALQAEGIHSQVRDRLGMGTLVLPALSLGGGSVCAVGAPLA